MHKLQNVKVRCGNNFDERNTFFINKLNNHYPTQQRPTASMFSSSVPVRSLSRQVLLIISNPALPTALRIRQFSRNSSNPAPQHTVSSQRKVRGRAIFVGVNQATRIDNTRELRKHPTLSSGLI